MGKRDNASEEGGIMGGRSIIPTIRCGSVISKCRELNYLLVNFHETISHASGWGTYQLDNDRVVQVLEEQKSLIEKILKIVKG